MYPSIIFYTVQVQIINNKKTQGVVKENKEIIDLAPNLPINIVGYFSTVKQNLEYQFV